MKGPNFFIIGAPKCGTTSLAAWLAEHPAVYLSPYKEPHYYSTDFQYQVPYNQREAYLSLFEGAGEEHLAVGEASVWYLRSRDAVPNIEREVLDARYIVMLRNPVEMAPSLHEQMCFSGVETVASFERAWGLQEARAQGRNLPLGETNPAWFQYRESCLLGAQLDRLYRTVPRQRVLPLLLDDVKVDPRAAWLQVQAFLGVPDDGRSLFPVYNRAKERRWNWFQRFNNLYGQARRRLGVPPLGTGILTALQRRNIRERTRPPLSPEMRSILVDAFAEDVRLLATLLERDLEHWLK